MTDTIARDLFELELDRIRPSETNRRVNGVDDLVPSIQAHGVLEPILVRQVPELGQPTTYILIAGERRWQAARLAGLETIPAVIHDVDEATAAELQLIENLKREDLDPLDEAAGYQRLLEFDGWSQRKLAERIGVSQGQISKRLQLLELPEAAQEAIGKPSDAGGITVTDAVALAKLVEHPKVIAEIIEEHKNDKWGDVDIPEEVETELKNLEEARQASAKRAELEAAGVRIIEPGNKPGSWNAKFARIGRYDALDVDPKKHAKESCHAVLLGDGWTRRPSPETKPVCTKPERHTKKGESTLKAKNSATATTRGRTAKSAAQLKRKPTNGRRRSAAWSSWPGPCRSEHRRTSGSTSPANSSTASIRMTPSVSVGSSTSSPRSRRAPTTLT